MSWTDTHKEFWPLNFPFLVYTNAVPGSNVRDHRNSVKSERCHWVGSSNVVGIICPPGCNRVNWTAKCPPCPPTSGSTDYYIPMLDYYATRPMYLRKPQKFNNYYHDGFQPKMSAGIINEHECMCFCLCNSGVISIYGIINRFACSIDLLHISK